MNRKKRTANWFHPYIKRNFNRTIFIAAKELSQDYRKFLLFYRMSKESFAEVVRVVGPAITKKCRQSSKHIQFLMYVFKTHNFTR
jgi:hypothetical protein